MLSNEEKRTLKEYVNDFQKWKKTEFGKIEIKHHREHKNYFKLRLAPEKISKLTKGELAEIYKQFWASRFWSNKDWKINKIIDENGLDNLKRCPGGVDTDMIKDMVNDGFNKSNTNFMKPEEVAKKIYDMIVNKKNYYNGQSIEFYNK